jgi:excinuclease ABC subunit A
MGPEGGAGGGELLVAGTPEQVAQHPRSHTGRFLATHLAEQTDLQAPQKGKP